MFRSNEGLLHQALPSLPWWRGLAWLGNCCIFLMLFSIKNIYLLAEAASWCVEDISALRVAKASLTPVDFWTSTWTLLSFIRSFGNNYTDRFLFLNIHVDDCLPWSLLNGAPLNKLNSDYTIQRSLNGPPSEKEIKPKRIEKFC